MESADDGEQLSSSYIKLSRYSLTFCDKGKEGYGVCTRSLKRSTTMTKKEMKRISNSATFTSLNTDSTALVSSDRWSAARCGCLRIGTFSSSPPLSPSPLPLLLSPSSSSSSSSPASRFLKPFWCASVALKLCCCTDLCRTYIEAEHARVAMLLIRRRRDAVLQQIKSYANPATTSTISTRKSLRKPPLRTKLSKPSPHESKQEATSRLTYAGLRLHYSVLRSDFTIYRPTGGSSFASLTIVLHGSPVDALNTLPSFCPPGPMDGTQHSPVYR